MQLPPPPLLSHLHTYQPVPTSCDFHAPTVPNGQPELANQDQNQTFFIEIIINIDIMVFDTADQNAVFKI